MKIAYVMMQFLVPSEAFSSLDVNTLRDMGHEVSCYGMRPKHRDYAALVNERGHRDMKINHLSFMNFIKAMIFALLNPSLVIKLLRWIIKKAHSNKRHIFKGISLIPSSLYIFNSIKKNPPDVLHLFWGHYPSIVGYLSLEYLPTVVTSVFLGAYDLNRTYGGSVSVANRADCVFTHSKENLPLLRKMNIKNINLNVVHRGTLVDDLILPQEDKFSRNVVPVFLTASRLIQVKRVDRVLELFASVHREFPQSILFIVGDGPERKMLEKQCETLDISESVEFHGNVPHKKLPGLMSTSHYFLLMSESESERLPNVVKEAMYQECVCIVTDTVGIGELVDHGRDGFIVKSGDVEAAGKIIKRLINNPEECKSISTKARQTIMSKFDIKKSMQKYLDIWQESLKFKSTTGCPDGLKL